MQPLLDPIPDARDGRPPTGACGPEEPAGQDARLLAFMRAHMEGARRWASVLAVPWHVAEDLVQDALIALWKKRARVEASKWSAWLWTAVLYLKYGRARVEGNALRHAPRIAMALEIAREEAPAPEDELSWREAERLMLWLLDQVEESRREVARRAILNGEPVMEIAKSLEIPEGTAKTRMLLALEDMRAALTRRQASQRSWAWLSGLAALLVALWQRFVGSVRARRGALFACAACGVLAITFPRHAIAPPPAAQEASEEHAIADTVYGFEPILPAWAEREREAAGPTKRAPAAAALREDELLRLAIQALERRRPDRAIAHLNEHAARFAEANVVVRGHLRRRALAALGDGDTAPRKP